MSFADRFKNTGNDAAVSVIIPIYNVEKYVDECLSSVINQTFKNIEIICIDDCSTDSSMDIVEKYADNDNRIKIIRNKQNMGQGISRNKAIDIARGKYILFVDSDDWMDADTIEYIYEKAKNDDLDLLLFKSKVFNDYTQKYIDSGWYSMKELDSFIDKTFNHWDLDANILFKIPVVPSGKLISKNLVDTYNLRFKENSIYEDNLFFYRCIFNAEHVSVIDKAFYHHRIRPNSTMDSYDERTIDIIGVRDDILNMILSDNRLFSKYHEAYYNFMIHSLIRGFSRIDPEYKNKYFSCLKDFITKCILEYDLSNDFRNCLDKNNSEFYDLVVLSINSDNKKIIELQNSIDLNNPIGIVVDCDNTTRDEVYNLFDGFIKQSIDFSYIKIMFTSTNNISDDVKELLNTFNDTYYNVSYLFIDGIYNEAQIYEIVLDKFDTEYIMFTNKNHIYQHTFIKDLFKDFRGNNWNMCSYKGNDSERDSFSIYNKMFKRDFLLNMDNPFIINNQVIVNPDMYNKKGVEEVDYSALIKVLESMIPDTSDNFYNFMIGTLRNNFYDANPKIKSDCFIKLKEFIKKCITEYYLDDTIRTQLDKNNLAFYNYVIMSLNNSESNIRNIQDNIVLDVPISVIVYCENNPANEIYNMLNSLIRQNIGFPLLEIMFVNNNSNDETTNVLNKLESIYYNVKHEKINYHVDKIEAFTIGINSTTSDFLMFMDKNHIFINNAFKNIFRAVRKGNMHVASGTTVKSKIPPTNTLIWTKIFKRKFIVEKNIGFILDENNDISVEPRMYNEKGIVEVDIPVVK